MDVLFTITLQGFRYYIRNWRFWFSMAWFKMEMPKGTSLQAMVNNSWKLRHNLSYWFLFSWCTFQCETQVKWDKNLPIETQISPWEVGLKKRSPVRILPDVETKRPCGQRGLQRDNQRKKAEACLMKAKKKFSSFIMLTPRHRNHLPL